MKSQPNFIFCIVKWIKRIKIHVRPTKMNFGLLVSTGRIPVLLTLTMLFYPLFPVGLVHPAKPHVSKVLKDVKPAQGDSTFIGTLHPTLKAAGGDWSIPRLTGTFGHAFSFSMKIGNGAVWQQANIDWWLLWDRKAQGSFGNSTAKVKFKNLSGRHPNEQRYLFQSRRSTIY